MRHDGDEGTHWFTIRCCVCHARLGNDSSPDDGGEVCEEHRSA